MGRVYRGTKWSCRKWRFNYFDNCACLFSCVVILINFVSNFGRSSYWGFFGFKLTRIRQKKKDRTNRQRSSSPHSAYGIWHLGFYVWQNYMWHYFLYGINIFFYWWPLFGNQVLLISRVKCYRFQFWRLTHQSLQITWCEDPSRSSYEKASLNSTRRTDMYFLQQNRPLFVKLKRFLEVRLMLYIYIPKRFCTEYLEFCFYLHLIWQLDDKEQPMNRVNLGACSLKKDKDQASRIPVTKYDI